MNRLCVVLMGMLLISGALAIARYSLAEQVHGICSSPLGGYDWSPQKLPLEISRDYQAPVSALDSPTDTLTMHWLYRGGHAEESGWARDT